MLGTGEIFELEKRFQGLFLENINSEHEIVINTNFHPSDGTDNQIINLLAIKPKRVGKVQNYPVSE